MMRMTRVVVSWVILAAVTVFTCGCAVISTAIGAGISYAIYQATK